MFKDVLEVVPVREKLLAPDIVLIARSGVPLTPVAEHLSVFLQRAAAQVHWPAPRVRVKA